MAVLHPLRVIIDNYPEGQSEQLECPNHPQNPDMGTRKVPFSKVLYIEQEDFEENPPKKYKRLAPGREVRLRSSYIIKFKNMVKDEKTGKVIELHCTYDPDTRNAPPADGRKIEGVIHWVSADHAVQTEVRLYDRLFRVSNPADIGDDVAKHLNPESLETLTTAYVEAGLKDVPPGNRYQFERLGYFCADSNDSSPEKPVFNRIVALRDSWAKLAQGKT
jgi:glutaminyl-tRNA synthetase